MMNKLSHGLFLLASCCFGASPAFAGDGDAMSSEVSAPKEAADTTGAEGTPVAEPANPSAPETGWQFSAGPTLWASSLKGDLGVTEETEPVAVDLSFGDILDLLKFVLMGNFEARNGRFVATADFLYLSLGATNDIEIRDADLLDGKIKGKTLISTVTAGYRAVDRDKLFVDVFAGGRINSTKVSLNLEGPQRTSSRSKTETWFDPVIGVRFQAPLGQDWSVLTYGDVGGFGVGSHFTWQLSGVVQYDLSRRWSLSAGWRHLKTDFEHNGFVFDAANDGPILGAVYRF